MATIDRSNLNQDLFLWNNLANGDDGQPLELTRLRGMLMGLQCVGNFGGGTLSIQVSNDGQNFVEYFDPRGNPLSFSSAGIADITAGFRWLRPVLSGGAAGSVDVILNASA